MLYHRTNSKINGVVYVPWAKGDLAELRTVSSLPMDFTDPDGLIRLADKQKARLAAWQRPGEICENPKMFHLISSFSIKQTLIGDCSFVASLGVCADFEKKFKKRLITSCIYPQNRHGDPIINPNGKYFIRLYLNGCRRKVVIDDLLPVDAFCNLLCSHSNSRDEFWISLLEKAYMKVMGGYDFPGSSSNNDLYALTGWIPERIDIKESDPQLTFKLVESKLRAGQALVTMGTGPLTKEESERSGLVPTHAYAVLKAQTIHGHKLFQLKNPWSEKRWKGHFSENDTSSWTPELKKALNYDQAQARQVDNGVFWIDLKSVIRFYNTLYINWNPDMFHYKYTIHDFWKPGEVEKDLYNISNNPQYSLQVSSDKACTIWILLSRHITTKSDFAKNEKFITLHVAGNTKGKRLYLPPDRAGYVHTGVKINTPHYLVKLTNIPAGNHSYTVIVSQLDSLSTIYYTIKVYGTCNFKFNAVPSIYAYRKELKGQWKANRPRPSYKLTLPASCNVMVELKGPR
jgi:calpain-7